MNLIHESLVQHHQLPVSPISSPLPIILADGSTLSHATKQVRLKYQLAHVNLEDSFIVAPIGAHSIILGMPFLEKTNPAFNWRSKTVHIREPDDDDDTSPVVSPASLSPNQSKPGKPSSPCKRKRQRKKKPRSPDYRPVSPITLPRISISTATMIHPGDIVYCLNLQPLKDPETPLPKEYLDFADSVFAEPSNHELPPRRPGLDHEIPLVDGAKPVVRPIYNLSENELKALKEYVDDYLKKGFIRPSTSPFGSPVLFVKKPDGSLRLCVDYRALNRMTVKNRHPLPLIRETLDRLCKARYFTKIDLLSAFNQIRIALGEEWKTAFRTRYGHFEYCVMPFGLTNAPATFQAFINSVLHEFLDKSCVAYLDDILIYSETLEEHVQHVRAILEKLRQNGLHARPNKCCFHARSVTFLGYIVSPDGIQMDPSRVSTILEWPVPESVHDIQVFLGLANYYRRFIEGYSRIVLPITDLLRKNTEFRWSSEAQAAFDELKRLYTSTPILKHFDPSLPIRLHTDSSGFALSGILSQSYEDRWHPVAFWSRKCLPAECNYDIYDREMLAVVEAMKHWRHYLEGSREPVQVLTDHKNLETFMSSKVLNRRQARWAEILANYDFVLVPIPGKTNPADAASRRPDYAKDVTLPSGTLIPSKALRLLYPETSSTPTTSPTLTAMIANLEELQTDQEPSSDLRDRIVSAYTQDNLVHQLKNLETLKYPWSWSREGLLLHDGLVYVPDNLELRIQLVREHHDAALAGHPGVDKTVELLSRNYFVPHVYRFVKEYVSSCEVCS